MGSIGRFGAGPCFASPWEGCTWRNERCERASSLLMLTMFAGAGDSRCGAERSLGGAFGRPRRAWSRRGPPRPASPRPTSPPDSPPARRRPAACSWRCPTACAGITRTRIRRASCSAAASPIPGTPRTRPAGATGSTGATSPGLDLLLLGLGRPQDALPGGGQVRRRRAHRGQPHSQGEAGRADRRGADRRSGQAAAWSRSSYHDREGNLTRFEIKDYRDLPRRGQFSPPARSSGRIEGRVRKWLG